MKAAHLSVRHTAAHAIEEKASNVYPFDETVSAKLKLEPSCGTDRIIKWHSHFGKRVSLLRLSIKAFIGPRNSIWKAEKVSIQKCMHKY